MWPECNKHSEGSLTFQEGHTPRETPVPTARCLWPSLPVKVVCEIQIMQKILGFSTHTEVVTKKKKKNPKNYFSMKPWTVTNSVTFWHPPRFLSLGLSFKSDHFPAEPSCSMKSYEVNIMRYQVKRTHNQQNFHSFSPHSKMPSACHMGEVISGQIFLNVCLYSSD